MLQYPSDLPDDEYSKTETAQNIDDQDGDEDESDDDPISILDKFMHVMKSVASRADAEKLAKDIVEDGVKSEHGIDNTGKTKVSEDQTNDDDGAHK